MLNDTNISHFENFYGHLSYRNMHRNKHLKEVNTILLIN